MRILLAVDGSENSYEAVRSLAHLRNPEQVTILHAIDVPRPAYPTLVPEVTHELSRQVEAQMREEGRRLLDRIGTLLPADIDLVAKQVEVGTPWNMIVEIAHSQRADLIMMGSRGLGAAKALLFGSVSHRVVSLASCPKLIVNGHVREMRRILLPLQGPEDTEAAIRFLALHPFRQPAELTVLTVLPFVPPMWPSAVVAEAGKAAVFENAREFVDSVAAQATGLGYKATGVAAIGLPAPTILHKAAQDKPDLIMMGSRRLRGVERFLLGSTAHAVLHQAACPVLVFQ